jgi:hypothetical protein
MLTAKRLREVLFYDPDTGAWTWIVRTSSRVRAGSQAGILDDGRRWRIGIDDRHYTGSRLAYLYMTGKWPPHLVDHIDRDPGHAAEEIIGSSPRVRGTRYGPTDKTDCTGSSPRVRGTRPKTHLSVFTGRFIPARASPGRRRSGHRPRGLFVLHDEPRRARTRVARRNCQD